MKINSTLLSLSCAAVVAALWAVYSAAVFALTVLAMNLSGEMGYLDFSNFDWKHAFLQFARFLIVWSGVAGLAGWLIGEIYNFLSEIGDTELKLK
jgi:hypothetical protein